MNRVSAAGSPPIDCLQIDHLQVLLQSCLMFACYKCISKLARSRPRSVSLSSFNLDLQSHLQTRSITASKCISTLTRSRTRSASLSSLNLDSITASECITEFTQSRSPIASPNSLDDSLKVYLQTHSITASKYISKERRWVYGDAGVTKVKWATRSNSLKVHLQTHLITDSQCISEFTQSWSPIASPNSLDHSLGVYVWVHLIVIFRCTWNCSQAPPAASPDIPCIDG